MDGLSLVENLCLNVGVMCHINVAHAHHDCSSPARGWVSRSELNGGGMRRQWMWSIVEASIEMVDGGIGCCLMVLDACGWWVLVRSRSQMWVDWVAGVVEGVGGGRELARRQTREINGR